MLELQRRRTPFFRLNAEALATTRVWFNANTTDGWTIQVERQEIAIQKISAAYFRRPGRPEALGVVTDPGERAYCEAEWSLVLQSIYSAIGNRWLNAPSNIAAAEDKPQQLVLAKKCGFAVPETIITNDFETASQFIDRNLTVGKSLREALIDGSEERVIFTSRIDSLSTNKAETVTVSPVIFQREILKAFDIRATVVGQRVFAVSINSQVYAETSVDWRRGTRTDLQHEIYQLPGEVMAACVNLVASLGLRFGAIDMILDRDGVHWFLEINPNGQWAWIENRTGLPISQAIVDELETISKKCLS